MLSITLRKLYRGTTRKGEWMGHKDDLYIMEEEKRFLPVLEIEPRLSKT
jgi:hypothetical protein